MSIINDMRSVVNAWLQKGGLVLISVIIRNCLMAGSVSVNRGIYYYLFLGACVICVQHS